MRMSFLAATALLTLGACSKKRPEVLPPAPVGSGGTGEGATDPNGAAGSGGAVVPGSDADFQRSVGSNTVLFALDQRFLPMGGRDAPRREQSEWLQARRRCGADRVCLARRYDARIATLQAVIDQRVYPHGPF